MINQETSLCEVCSSEFSYYSSTRPNPRFCSYKCMGLATRGRPTSLKLKLPVDEIVSAYLSGETSTQIAKRYGVAKVTIISRLEEAGIDRRKQKGYNLRLPSSIAKAKANHRRGKQHHGYRDLPMVQIAKDYLSGESTVMLGKKHGVASVTIGKKLKKHGVELRPPGFGRPQKCVDGHIVASQLERAVDDWLYVHNLAHEIQPRCPWDSPKRGCPRADFLVNGFYIEVWGVEGSKKYNQRRLEKIRLYKECGAKLLQIFPHHILDKDYSPLEILL